MMIHAYSEFYLNDAKQNLAEFFDYAINACHFEADLFSKLFVQSGYADKFERGNPSIVAGMSGIELAKKVILYAYPDWNFPDQIFFRGAFKCILGWMGISRISMDNMQTF